jgi:hypothetical protein
MRYNNMKFSGLFMVLPMLFCVGNAFGYVADNLYTYYNITADVKSGTNFYAQGLTKACVGKGVQNCGPAQSIMMFIAQTINPTGAKFCMNQVYTNDEHWVVYYLPKEDKSRCFWLCQPGYGGPDCSETVNGDTCYPEELYSGAFSTYELTSNDGSTSYTENEDWLVDRFLDGNAVDRFSSEREIFIAITDWLPSKHGAMVSPVIAYGAENTGNSGGRPYTTVAKLGNDVLMCAPGYKRNASNTDCEPVNSTTCTLAAMTFCSGFEKDKYDASIHVLEQDSSGCYRYFCKSSNQAFPSALDASCQNCAKRGRGGPSKTNGVCVVCPAGKYFVQESNECRDASAYSKSDMQFGRNNSTKDKPIVEQCWNITEPLAYKKCVLSGITSGGNSGNGGSGGGNNSGNSGSGGGTGSIGKYFQKRIPDVSWNKVNAETVSVQEPSLQYQASKNTGMEKIQ